MKFTPTNIWNQSVILIQRSGYYEVVENCNSYTVTNTGDTIVFVNDCVLYPGTPGTILGDSRTFGGHPGEVYKGVIKISFQVPLGAAPSLELIEKFYP